ncbi:uncharacterized protein [Physcomitrium patens]|uniref:Uncharacterized protein n=1 Tax=Physcomitrium patens TaxID=3218 RepID=A0A2K1IRD3_PHYPA|nr:uncharacterized protein LOC112274249 isoform X2 [Physcomitrium patens]PNR31842.1 hypothetical protein PHYPA_025965 [Physcomitrium patens]|eukprot:XP_024359337.1 uncharacterized protein LOC112274249 isoform X2 [Physcomitrella patens]
MAASVRDVPMCTTCCSFGSVASTPGCSNFELSDAAGQSLRFTFPADGMLKLPLRNRQRRKQLGMQVVARSFDSPLIEGFESTLQNLWHDPKFTNNSKDSAAIGTSSPVTTSQEQFGARINEVEDIGHDFDTKRSARCRPPQMSISQGFSSAGRRAVSHTAVPAGHPLHSVKLPGPMGIVIAFSVAALGLKTAVKNQGFMPGTPQKVCEKCDGYGVQSCHVCQGRGILTWEGKLRHTDPCPLCIGRCIEKCSSCGGVKRRKGLPPALESSLSIKFGSNKK